MEIITNNQERATLYWNDLTPKQQAEFNYDTAEESTFVIYKDWVYDINEFIYINHDVRGDKYDDDDELSGWDGYSSDSYFSGVLIKYSDDCETVIVGRFFN